MEEEIIVLENGTRICPHCVAGEIKCLGGPCGVGIEGAGDPNVLFLHKCDVCSHLFTLRNEAYRLRMVEEYEGHWDSYNRKFITFIR